jgi:hypothetical protein
MGDIVPQQTRIDRGALERIIRRAAELQAGEREIGEGLTEPELMRLGQEVGIPEGYLRRALAEERTQAVIAAERGVIARWTGPTHVTAQRVVAGEAATVLASLNHWMTEGELLRVKRRFPDQTSWEPRQDMFASIKRGFQAGGRAYRLSHARDVMAQVTQLEERRSHVQLVADMSNTRRAHVNGAIAVTSVGAVATGIGVTLGVFLPVAMAPVALGMLVGYGIGRGRRGGLETMQVALEQVLDRLEHGELNPAARPEAGNPLARIAEEIRRSFRP